MEEKESIDFIEEGEEIEVILDDTGIIDNREIEAQINETVQENVSISSTDFEIAEEDMQIQELPQAEEIVILLDEEEATAGSEEFVEVSEDGEIVSVFEEDNSETVSEIGEQEIEIAEVLQSEETEMQNSENEVNSFEPEIPSQESISETKPISTSTHESLVNPALFFATDEDFDEGDEPMDPETLINRIMIGFGIAIALFAIVLGIFTVIRKYAERGMVTEPVSFDECGNELLNIGIVGGDNIEAIAAAAKERFADIEVAEKNYDYNETDEKTGVISVSTTLTSILKDLKIKFVNSKDKLIANVPFQVELTNPKGKTQTITDEDKDGMIYLTELEGGNYTVSLVPLAGYETMYEFSAKKSSVNVKSQLDYQKVDVKNEVKKVTTEIAKKEDTAKKETQVESELKDTVAYVSSSKEGGDGYQEIELSQVINPVDYLRKLYEVAYVSRNMDGLNAPVLVVSDNDHNFIWNNVKGADGKHTVVCDCGESRSVACQDKDKNKICDICGAEITKATAEITITGNLNITALSDKNGISKLEKTVKIVENNEKDVKESAFAWSSSDNSVATVSQTGEVKGIKEGTAKITYRSELSNGISVEQEVTVTVKELKVKLNYDVKKLIFCGTDITDDLNKLALTATVENFTSDNTVTWKSSDSSIATVSENGVVTGLKEGTATITAISKEGSEAKRDIPIVVSKHPKELDNALTDVNGGVVYVYNSEKKAYEPAKYSDYYKGVKFYAPKEDSFKYTGWWTIDGKTYYFDSEGKKVTGEQVILGAKYSFSEEGVLKGGTGSLGVDVSTWNGNVDWNKVKKSGVNYAIIRCGFRGSTQGGLYEDNQYYNNIKNATAAGMKVGIYFFTQAVSEAEAVEEASMVLEMVKGYNITYPIFIDVESADNGRANGLSKAERTAIIKAFCKTISNGGYKAGVYANKYWLESCFNASELTNYTIWLAQYAANPTYTATRYDMWQYSCTGKIDGISGNVDLNLSYLAY